VLVELVPGFRRGLEFSFWVRSVRQRMATAVAEAAMPIRTRVYPYWVKRMPAAAVAPALTREFANMVVAAAVLRSASGVSFMRRL
jgi:hypothetical protein